MAKRKSDAPVNVGVDSATLLIIDPCYLADLLQLTPEQTAAWDAKWIPTANSQGISSIHIAGNANAIVLSDFGGDGIFTPRQVAWFLNGGNQMDYLEP